MNSSLALSIDRDLHFVLCAFGRSGLAYVETDPIEHPTNRLASMSV
jgi:hypothetical protein